MLEHFVIDTDKLVIANRKICPKTTPVLAVEFEE